MRRIQWTRLRGVGPGPVPPVEKPSKRLQRIPSDAARRHFMRAMLDSFERQQAGELPAAFSAWMKGKRCEL